MWTPERTINLRILLVLLVACLLAVACDDEPEEDPGPKVKVPDEPPESEEGEEGEGQTMDFTKEESGQQAGSKPKKLARAAANDKRMNAGQGDVTRTKETKKGPKRVTVEANFLKVDAVLDKTDIRESTGYTGLLERAGISGQVATKKYNSTRWRSETESEFGFGVQVWKPGTSGQAAKKFDGFYAQSMGGERTRDVGDDSFRTEHHSVRSLYFLDRRRSAVAAVTCDRDLCDFEQLAELARRVQRKL